MTYAGHDEPPPDPKPAVQRTSREERRHPDDLGLPVPVHRKRGSGMVYRGGNQYALQPPNDMQPRDVDRKKIKKRRRQAAANRRKRT